MDFKHLTDIHLGKNKMALNIYTWIGNNRVQLHITSLNIDFHTIHIVLKSTGDRK
jgi:hypothetical protein